MRCNPTASIASFRVGIFSTAFPASTGIKVWRCKVKFDTLPNANVALSTDRLIGAGAVFQASNATIYAGYQHTERGATGVTVTTGVTYVLDVKVDTSANPWTIDVQVNGVACGQHTRAVAADTGSEELLCGFTFANSTANALFDDFLCSQTAADYPLGAGYVHPFVPTADGTHNIAGAADFRRGDTTTDILNGTTTAFQLIDDVPLDDATPATDDHIRIVAPANVTEYVECIFGPAPGISAPTTGPRAVEVIAEVFAAGTGVSDEIIKLNDNGTVDNVYDGTAVAGVTTGTYKRKHYALAPTGGAWVVGGGGNGDFLDLRMRYGFASDANPDKSLMCIMIEAEFAEVAAVPRQKRLNVNQACNRATSY